MKQAVAMALALLCAAFAIGQTNVAVVDFETAANNHPTVQALAHRISIEIEPEQARLRDLMTEIRSMRARLANLTGDENVVRDAEAAVRIKATEYEQAVAELDGMMETRLNDARFGVQKDVEEAFKRVVLREGYDLVFVRNDAIMPHISPWTDITGKVVQILQGEDTYDEDSAEP